MNYLLPKGSIVQVHTLFQPEQASYNIKTFINWYLDDTEYWKVYTPYSYNVIHYFVLPEVPNIQRVEFDVNNLVKIQNR